ncbi:MAG: hypothetical protein WCT05_05720 [Lentisphaeria bacterium]
MPGKVYLVLRLDTEDFLLEDSDDSTLRLANIMDACRVRGNFNITGKKIEGLLRRGRSDVINVLKKHDITSHSYGHSLHPSVREFLSETGWSDGIVEFIRRESVMVNLIRKTFGKVPIGYGHGGGNWAPQAYGAMHALGMKVYTSMWSYLNPGPTPYWYCGILQMDTTLRSGDVDDPERGMKIHLESVQKARSMGGGLLNFAAHDCNFTTGEYWDEVNFRNGAMPPENEWKKPRPFSKGKQEERWLGFERYLQYALSFQDLQVVTPTEICSLYADQHYKHIFNYNELAKLAADSLAEISYRPFDGGYLSAAEIFYLLVSFSLSRLTQRGKPQQHYIANIFGPVRRCQTDKRATGLPWHHFAASLIDINDYMTVHGHIPAGIRVGSMLISPSDYLATLASIFHVIVEDNMPATVSIMRARLVTEDLVNEERVRDIWRWLTPDQSFTAPGLVELAKLQCWTYKPAVLSNR